jgi:hypothetical protein
MTPLAYNRNNVASLNKYILKVVKLNSHLVHVLNAIEKWRVRGDNMKRDET